MTSIVKVKTGSKFEELGSYSRLVAVDNLIFMSNTAGRNPRTKLIPTDLREQTLQVLSNIETALASVDACLADIVAARVFIQFPEDVDTIMQVYGEKMRGIPLPVHGCGNRIDDLGDQLACQRPHGIRVVPPSGIGSVRSARISCLGQYQ